MKYFILRYIKLAFFYLQLHRIFGLFSSLYFNLYYFTRLSKWIYDQKKIGYNDYPCKWNYDRRYAFYQWVIDNEKLDEQINYLEFGVASGESFKWFAQRMSHLQSRLCGFDTFDGLPEDWGPFKKGAFSNNSQPPEINDTRCRFYKGLFQQTLPAFLKDFDAGERTVVMMDADLYSATLYVLTCLAPYLKKGDIIFFDEFVVPTHEFKAFLDFTESYYIKLELIAAANNYYFAAFKVV